MKLSFSLFLAFIISFSGHAQSSTAHAQLDMGTVVSNVYADGSISQTKLKSTGKSINYQTDLWLAGTKPNGDQCFAAQMYSQSGVDYIPGPISQDPNAYAKWNKVWKINKSTVDSFTAGYFMGLVPPIIKNWPAHGDTNLGESYYLAPFNDVDGDNYYNPSYGDHPCFPGDQAIFFMFKDDTIHANVETPSMRVEIFGLAYVYQPNPQNPFLDSAVFLNYSIRNKGQKLTNFKAGIFTDFDLGRANNDLFGTDVDRDAAYMYNATPEDTVGPGFGPNPFSSGIVVRCGLRADKGDGIDNDKDGCIDGQRDALGNCIPESDSANIHEYWGLTSHIYFNNGGGIIGGPSGLAQYQNILNGLWRDGSPIVIENPSGFLDLDNGDGYDTTLSGATTKFVFPGNSYQSSGAFEPLAPTNWFCSPNNVADARSVLGLGKGTLLPNGIQQVQIAFFLAQDTSSVQNVGAMNSMMQNLADLVEDPPLCNSNRVFGLEENNLIKVHLAPNPTTDFLTLTYSHNSAKHAYIYNAQGVKMSTLLLKKEGTEIIDVMRYPAGIYVLQIGQQRKTFSVVK